MSLKWYPISERKNSIENFTESVSSIKSFSSIKSVSSTDISNLTQEEIISLTPAQLGEFYSQFTPTQIGYFTKDQLSNFTDEYLINISEAQVTNALSYLSPTQVSYFTQDQINKYSKIQFNILLPKMSAIQIGNFTKEQINSLSEAQLISILPHLTPTHFSYLTKEQLYNSNTFVSKLLPIQISYLNIIQIESILMYLTNLLVPYIAPSVISQFTLFDFNYLFELQLLKYLTNEQLNAISDSMFEVIGHTFSQEQQNNRKKPIEKFGGTINSYQMYGPTNYAIKK